MNKTILLATLLAAFLGPIAQASTLCTQPVEFEALRAAKEFTPAKARAGATYKIASFHWDKGQNDLAILEINVDGSMNDVFEVKVKTLLIENSIGVPQDCITLSGTTASSSNE